MPDGQGSAQTAPALPQASLRVAEAAARAGLQIDIRIFAEGCRTAGEAAAACGCPIGAIVKSLVFRGSSDGGPRLLLVSGANRVDEALVGERLGESLGRPDAAFVREWTGFAIGGIPPIGHARPMPVYMDEALLTHASVWAAAGTPTTMFAVVPQALQGATGAKIIAVTL
jgi:prolyl-tRNA editing enzyme YbaK/EbsC (Cys-tRNA(Pro) deacylase)